MPMIDLLRPCPDPPSVPYRGIVTDPVEAISLGMGGGRFALVQNMRSSGGSLQARFGGVPLIVSPPSGCTAGIDLFCPLVNGTQYALAAFTDGTNTRIYVTQNFATWAELTETSGLDDNTRFLRVATKMAWSVWTTPQSIYGPGRDVVIVSDGESVRLWSPETSPTVYDIFSVVASGGTNIVLHTAMTLPYQDGQGIRIDGTTGLPGLNGIWTIQHISGTTITLENASASLTAVPATVSVSGALITALRLWKHAAPLLPANAEQFHQTATFANFVQVAGGTRSYPSSTKINGGTPGTSGFSFSDTTSSLPSATSPYTGSNKCIYWYARSDSSAAPGRMAIMGFSSVFNPTSQLAMVIEATSSAVAVDALENTKLQISKNPTAVLTVSAANPSTGLLTTGTHNLTTGDAVEFVDLLGGTWPSLNGTTFYAVTVSASTFKIAATYADATASSPTLVSTSSLGTYTGSSGRAMFSFVTFYDPTATDNNINHPAVVPVPIDTSLRYLWVFNLGSLEPNEKTSYFFKAVRVGAQPTEDGKITILNIASGGNWEGTTTWAIGYESSYAYAESPGFQAMTEDVDFLSGFGGPTLVTSGTSKPFPSPKLTNPMEGVFYDYKLVVKNPHVPRPGPGFAGFNGGLSGNPDSVAVYVSPAGSSGENFYYLLSVPLVEAIREYHGTGDVGWQYDFTSVNAEIVSYNYFRFMDRTMLDPAKTLPTSYQQPIPPSSRYFPAYGRLFAGQAHGLTGEVWFSAKDFSARFQRMPITNAGAIAEELGGRAVFPSEVVSTVFGNASDEGVSSVYVLTSSAAHAMGQRTTNGTSFSASNLGSPIPLSPHGSFAPDSAVEALGTLFWLDQYGTIVLYSPGEGSQVQGLSVRAVGDRFTSLPVGRLPYVTAASLGSRIYFCYTPFDGSVNSRCLVYNTYFNFWESDDLLPAGWDFARLRRVYDVSKPGMGQRLFGLTSTGKLFAYEESTGAEFSASKVACRVTTGLLCPPAGTAYLGQTRFVGQSETGESLTITRNYVESGDAWTSNLALTDAKNPGFAYIANYDTVRPTDPGAGRPQRGTQMYADYAWNYSPGKRLDGLQQEVILDQPQVAGSR